MRASQRIAVNALATYGRTVFAMVLGLFSGRWLLQALGPVDYGLLGVVGALITFVTFLNNVTSASVARFLALSIGKGDRIETSRWFNAALSIHTILPALLIAIGWPAGEWTVKHFFNIPPERLSTACWVFRFSLLSAFWHMSVTPYMGMFTAKQRIYEMSLWGIVQSLCTFGLAYFLTCYHGDAWLLYSAGSVSIIVSLSLCQVLRARCLFDECRVRFCYLWNWGYMKRVTSFASLQLFGTLGRLLRGQGTAILLNKYFNPLQFPDVNASYAVGSNVSSYTQSLSISLTGAFIPEITATEGRGNRERMLWYSNRASKFGTVLVMLFSIPLMVEIKYVLVLWLKNPPQMAWLFCMLILVQSLIDKVTVGYAAAVSAHGRIAGYQLWVGGTLILTLPLAWIFLAFGFSAVSVAYAFNITSLVSCAGRVFMARYLLQASCLKWMTEVLVPCASLCAVGLCVGFLVRHLISAPSLVRLGAVFLSTFVSWCGCGWFLVLDRDEKRFMQASVRSMYRKLILLRAAA